MTMLENDGKSGVKGAASAGTAVTQQNVLRRAGESGGSARLGPQARPARLPLSFSQDRLWMVDQIGGIGSAYNVVSGVQLTGSLDVAALEAALSEIVRRHEILRSRIESEGGVAAQVVAAPEPVRLRLEQIDGSEVQARLDADATRVFDLTKGPLYRFCLLKTSGTDDYILQAAIHHIATDGWSSSILMREIAVLYGAFLRGQPSPLPELPLQYADYAIWQRNRMGERSYQKELKYWCDSLASAPALLSLPWDRPRPVSQSFRGTTVPVNLSTEVLTRLKDLADATGSTLYMVLLAAFNVVLNRWSRQDDIVVGTVIAGRTESKLEELIGLFTNTLALRVDSSGNPTFTELIARVRDVTLDAYTHQEMPFERIVEVLQPVPDLSRQPIFQAMLVLQNMPRAGGQLPELKLKRINQRRSGSKVDVSLVLTESQNGLHGHYEFATDLFDVETIERLARHTTTAISALAADARLRVAEVPLLDAEEADTQLAWGRGQPTRQTLTRVDELLSQKAATVPDRIALVSGKTRVTYRELEERSNRLAHYLREIGVGPEDVVGLNLDRSIELVVCLVAILKAGGAFLPLDPAYPLQRLEFMATDAAPRAIITSSSSPQLDLASVRKVDIDQARDEIQRYPAQRPVVAVTLDHPAYVLYTSGSTGRPKGIIGTHRSIAARLHADVAANDAQAIEVYAQKTTINAIDFMWELFMPLTRGEQVALISPDAVKDPQLMVEELGAAQASRIVLVPSLLRALLDYGGELASRLPALRYWASVGEPLQTGLAHAFAQVLPDATLVNLYGTSEFWDATWHVAGTGDDYQSGGVPLGRPLESMSLYVLDHDLQLLPTGAVGELYIAGPSLARGYLGRPDLTAERFVPSPFDHGTRLYRTGDLVRWRAHGILQFVGRADFQVKIRGFRIELGEIEGAFKEHPGIKEAVVIARNDMGPDTQLVAYVVAHGEALPEAVEPDVLRADLAPLLPEYMLPATIVVLDRLPLLPNGKYDRATLPKPDQTSVVAEKKTLPRTPVEAEVVRIFEEILGRNDISIGSSFFLVGGHSLTAMRAVARVRDHFKIDIPVRALFEHPTPAQLAQVVDGLLVTQGGAADDEQFNALSELSVEELERALQDLASIPTN